MSIQGKSLAIIGGGPGGVTLARLLQINGVKVKVYERDAGQHVRVQGATLDLHEESGLEALRKAGLLDAFYQHYRPGAGKICIMDQQGTEKFVSTEMEEARPEIDRGPLLDMLLASLAPDTVVWNSHFQSLTQLNGGWQIHFKNGTCAVADIVIGADGANSKIRPYVTDIKPVYSGITAMEANLSKAADYAPKLYHRLGGGKIFAFGEGKSLILTAKGDGCLSFYTGCKVDEHWKDSCAIEFADKASVLNWFKQEFANWDSSWQELFAGDDMYFVARPQYYYPIDQAWAAKNNITLLGDAAHLMPPYAGEGVNMAMQDAFELSEQLLDKKHSNIHAAISAYEQQMRNRAAKATQLTLDNTDMLHSEHAVEKLVAMFAEFSPAASAA